MTTIYAELIRFAAGLDHERPYHQPTQFLWSLSINADGSPMSTSLVPLASPRTDKKGNVKVAHGASHVTPTLKRTAGVDALIPHDGLGYVLGWCDGSSRPDRISQAHQAYRALVEQWAIGPGAGDPIARAMHLFFSGQGPTLIEHPECWTSKDNLLLLVGSQPAHLAQTLPGFWADHVEARKGRGTSGTCLVCGNPGMLVDTLPQMVRGPLIPGGQSSGVAPISINAPAFGYNLSTGLAHVPVCNQCARGIPAAFNSLLSDEARRHVSESTVTTWWIRGKEKIDPLNVLDHTDERDVVALINDPDTGQATPVALEEDRFNCMVVSGNGPRLIVHDWTSIPLHELKLNIAAWFTDTETIPERGSDSPFTPLWRLAAATGRFDPSTGRYLPLTDKAGHHPSGLVNSLRRVALAGSAPPHQLIAWVVTRVSSDHRVDTPRASLLRLALRRTFSRGNLMPGLDPTCTEPCYVAGRLFAEYAQLQYAAATMDGGNPPNSTFADKNFAGAITNPALAITSGEKQSAAWLSKLRRKGWDSVHIQALDSLMELLDSSGSLPLRASVEQQAMFILGYHHQRASNSNARDAARQKRLSASQTSPTED